MLNSDRTSRVQMFGGPVLIECKHLLARRRYLIFATCHRCGEPLGARLDNPTLVVTEAFIEDALMARRMLTQSLMDAIARDVRKRDRGEHPCRCTWMA